MQYLGDYAEDYATLNFKFSTHQTDGTPITLSGTPVISVYKANNPAQATAGISLNTDFGSVTGMHHVLIDLSADDFYEAGSDYQVVITAGTVDSISVIGTVLAHFSIENRNESKISSILEDTGTTIPALIAAIGGGSGGGSGAIPFVYTLTDADDGTPIDGAGVWITTDAAGVNIVASGRTDAYGVVTFMLDAGVVYLWRKKSGYNFTNPDTQTVS